MKNKDDPKVKAWRIFNHYREVEKSIISKMDESDWYDPLKLKQIAGIQKRRAFAGEILKIGIIRHEEFKYQGIR